MASRLAKPQLRGLLTSQLKRDAPVAILVSAACVAAYKYLVYNPRKEKYADFYDEYDADKVYQSMKKAGVFTCVNKDGVIDSSNW